MLDIIKRKKPDILVECKKCAMRNLDNLDPHKIDFMLSYGQRKYFLNLMSNDYRKIECADNRLRLGMLRSQVYEFEETLINILKSGEAGLKPEILKILPFLLGGLKVVKSDDIRALFSGSYKKQSYI